MKTETTVTEERDAFSRKLAVEMTDAAYRVALKYGISDQWLDLQLDLWKAMTQAIDRSRADGLILSKRTSVAT